MKFPPKPKTPYVLEKPRYRQIFDKLAKFEGKNLNELDEKLVKFLYSQLEENWETPLEELIDEMLKK